MKAELAAAGIRWAGAAAGLIICALAMSGPPAIIPSGEIAGNGCIGAGETDGIVCMT